MLQDKTLVALLVACSFAALMGIAEVLLDVFRLPRDAVVTDAFRLAVSGALTAIVAYRVKVSNGGGKG